MADKANVMRLFDSTLDPDHDNNKSTYNNSKSKQFLFKLENGEPLISKEALELEKNNMIFKTINKKINQMMVANNSVNNRGRNRRPSSSSVNYYYTDENDRRAANRSVIQDLNLETRRQEESEDER